MAILTDSNESGPKEVPRYGAPTDLKLDPMNRSGESYREFAVANHSLRDRAIVWIGSIGSNWFK